jgi:uncharacterized protein YutE (UPF0331/DUF86 family)
MQKLPIERDVIIKRLNGVQSDVAELSTLGNQALEEFSNGSGHKLAEYHLHRALEGVLNISAHILSRIPGGQATQYAEIARKMGEFGLIDKEFSETRLVKMANYRNRLVHFYAEIEPQELLDILHNNLQDFDIFLLAIKNILEHPGDFGLIVDQ